MKKNKLFVLVLCTCALWFSCSPLGAVDDDYINSLRSEKNKRALVFETLGGVFGPLTTAGKLLGNGIGLTFSIFAYLLAPDYVMYTFPVTVPFGVNVAGEYFEQGNSFWAAFIGGTLASGIYYASSGLNPAENSGTLAAYYFADVVGSVIGYNVIKIRKKKAIEPDNSSKMLFPALYLSRMDNTEGYRLNVRFFAASF